MIIKNERSSINIGWKHRLDPEGETHACKTAGVIKTVAADEYKKVAKVEAKPHRVQ